MIKGRALSGANIRVRIHRPRCFDIDAGVHYHHPPATTIVLYRQYKYMQPTVAVIDASIGDTPAERNLRRSLDADVDVYKVSEGEFPPAVTSSGWQYDAVVFSGSQTAVYDDHDWIHELTAWFRSVHAADVPALGICWGHQFVAQALGGRVVDMNEYEIGYRTVERRGDDPLFADVPRTFSAFQTHSDRVAELPAGAVELARNDYGIQAFRDGSSYGVQFHPEYDSETAEWVIRNKDFSETRTQRLLDGVTDEAVASAAEAATLFDAFVDSAADHGRRPERRF
jgi:GMP synthase (glutamine-hydrolysing)